MSEYVKMGTRFRSDYTLKRVQLSQGQGYEFERSKGEPLNDDLKGGVLVRRSVYKGDDWQPVESLDTSATYRDLSMHYGVWKDKGWILADGEIQPKEVTPLFDLFNRQLELGWAGQPTIGCHLFGFIDDAWLGQQGGEPTLRTIAPVTSKTYANYGSDDSDICLDVYMKLDAQNERR